MISQMLCRKEESTNLEILPEQSHFARVYAKMEVAVDKKVRLQIEQMEDNQT